MFRITSRFEFDTAHRLHQYRGPCSRLHGHHYVVDVTVQGPRLDGLGMLMDFGRLKSLVNGLLMEEWDHRTLLHSDDPLVGVLGDECRTLSQDDGRRLLSGRNATAENMAFYVYNWIKEGLPKDVAVYEVKVFETPDNWCVYSE